MGHKVAQCPRKSSHSTKKTHATTQNPPPPCPSCGDSHAATGADGKTFYRNRLSACDDFRSKSLDERATIIQQVKGCILCLDWTGDHQVKNCQGKGKFDRAYEPCKNQVNGSMCSKRHNHLLHGTGNAY